MGIKIWCEFEEINDEPEIGMSCRTTSSLWQLKGNILRDRQISKRTWEEKHLKGKGVPTCQHQKKMAADPWATLLKKNNLLDPVALLGGLNLE